MTSGIAEIHMPLDELLVEIAAGTEDEAYQALASKAIDYLYNSPDREPAKAHTTQWYFEQLLKKAIETRTRGNYGISACVVIKTPGTADRPGQELIIYGQNGMVDPGHPHAHAEMHAISNVYKLLQASDLETVLHQLIKDGLVTINNYDGNEKNVSLYTTLEPCPMCTVGSVVNPGIKSVVIGAFDEKAGGLDGKRGQPLRSLWADMLKGTEISYVQSDHHDGPHYVDSDLIELLFEVFFEHREAIDEHISRLDQGRYYDLANRISDIVRAAMAPLPAE